MAHMLEIQDKFSKGDHGKGSSKSSNVRFVVNKRIYGGVEGAKHRGEVWIARGGRERKAGDFFLKSISIKGLDIKKVMARYHWLKKRRFPVLDTFRYSSKTNTLLMTELSRGGTRILIDRHHPLAEFGITPSQIKNWGNLKDEVERIAEGAYDKGEGLELDEDNYLIALDKSGNEYRGELRLVDIGFGANFLSELGQIRRELATLENNINGGRIFINEIQGLPSVPVE